MDEEEDSNAGEDNLWDAPLEAVWEGWDDPSPENFLVVLLSAVVVATLALVSARLLVVLVSVLLTALKYSTVALLLVAFGVFFA